MAARKRSTKKSEKTSSNKSEKSSSGGRSMRRRGSSSPSDRKHGVKEKAAVKAPAKKNVAAKAAQRPVSQKKKRKAGAAPASRISKPAEKSVVRSGKTKPAPKRSANGRKAVGRSSKAAVAEVKSVKSGHRQAETKVTSKTKTSKPAEPSLSPAKPAKGGNLAVVNMAPGVESAPIAATPKAISQVLREPKAVSQEGVPLAARAKPTGQRQGFKINEFVVYPAHGVGQIVSIEEQEVAGFKLELFVINFSKDKMTLRVPTSKVTAVGMRKISDPEAARRSLDILTGRARIKRTMWSRRAQEYETKINSGDINAIAEVVRDLYRSDAQPEQSYSERQLYEAALDRLVREIAAVQKSNESEALKAVEAQLQKSHYRAKQPDGPQGEAKDPEIDEAA
jgi:CarD family transcriptional regulator